MHFARADDYFCRITSTHDTSRSVRHRNRNALVFVRLLRIRAADIRVLGSEQASGKSDLRVLPRLLDASRGGLGEHVTVGDGRLCVGAGSERACAGITRVQVGGEWLSHVGRRFLADGDVLREWDFSRRWIAAFQNEANRFGFIDSRVHAQGVQARRSTNDGSRAVCGGNGVPENGQTHFAGDVQERSFVVPAMQSNECVGISTGDVVRIFAPATTGSNTGRSSADPFAATAGHTARHEHGARGDGGIDARGREEARQGVAIGRYLPGLSRRSARAAFVYEHVRRLQVRVERRSGFTDLRAHRMHRHKVRPRTNARRC